MRKPRLLVACAAWALVVPGVAAAQSTLPALRPTDRDLPAMTAAQLAEAEPLLKPFFERLSAGQHSEAFRGLTADVMMSGSPPVWLPQMVGTAQVMFETYGGITRHELVESRCLTPEICRNVYVLHTPFLPVYFILGLYRWEDGTWVPTQMNLTDQAGQVF
jgi:hypothetical protein